MSSSMRAYGTRKTPQSAPIPGKSQVQNSAGGYVFGLDNWARLQRWLILGSDGGSYYATERKLTFENLDVVKACIAEDGLRTVACIVEISQAGRAPKNDYALFALAMASSLGDDKTRAQALDCLPLVARIGTHLFQFISYVEQFRAWGRGLRRGVGRWYTEKDPEALAYQIIKYRQRENWTHHDVLHKVHIGAKGHAQVENEETKPILRYLARTENVKGNDKLEMGMLVNLPRVIQGFELVQKATAPEQAAKIVTDYNLPWETVPTQFLNSLEVRRALLPNMPMTALVRNLATLTRLGLLTSTSKETQHVLTRLRDKETIAKSRIHPLNVLMAQKTYAAGRSLRGDGSWAPVPQIVDALDDVFYAAFDNVEATGKRRLIALDISGSMWGYEVAGIPGFTPAEASAAMAMVSIRTGDPYEVAAFTSASRGYGYYGRGPAQAPNEIYPGLSIHPLSPRQRLDDIGRLMAELSYYMGGTDCSLPMLYAKDAQREFDVFEIFTDNETRAGKIHPTQALQEYRRASGIDAKLVVYGMISNGFSIADPSDPGMLDVVGFDTAAPSIVDAFVRGGF